jgi:hypothetical protein
VDNVKASDSVRWRGARWRGWSRSAKNERDARGVPVPIRSDWLDWLVGIDRRYCTGVAVDGIGSASDPQEVELVHSFWKIVPRTSVANARVPVLFGETGTAFA